MTSLLSWMAPFCITVVSRMCCHGNVNTPIWLKFGTKVQHSMSNKIKKLRLDCLRNDFTVTSLLFWRTRSFLSTLPRKFCYGNSKGSILKLLLSNKFLYIFRKSHQIWLNYLSPFLHYGQKTAWLVTNKGRIGLSKRHIVSKNEDIQFQ